MSCVIKRSSASTFPGDGEFGKSMSQRVNYGAWWRYSWQRLAGIDPGQQTLYEMQPRRSRPARSC